MDLAQNITDYSAQLGVDRGRAQHADNFDVLTTSTFAGLVIDPLGISCTGGGNNEKLVQYKGFSKSFET